MEYIGFQLRCLPKQFINMHKCTLSRINCTAHRCRAYYRAVLELGPSGTSSSSSMLFLAKQSACIALYYRNVQLIFRLCYSILIERAVSYWHLHQLILQTTLYLDSWLSELKMKLLEIEGDMCPIAGDATAHSSILHRATASGCEKLLHVSRQWERSCSWQRQNSQCSSVSCH